uniref:Beta-galactosidase n=1 Tax=Ascaris lumbricoides TaxID=6252 RepID=A0A0M3IQW0_ASCLU
MRAAGLNAIQFYIPWNFHEIYEGVLVRILYYSSIVGVSIHPKLEIFHYCYLRAQESIYFRWPLCVYVF